MNAETIRRTEMLALSMKILDALAWFDKPGNIVRLNVYKDAFESRSLSEVWHQISRDSWMKPLFDSMGTTGREILRRGMRGDSEATEIFLQITDRLIGKKVTMEVCGSPCDCVRNNMRRHLRKGDKNG